MDSRCFRGRTSRSAQEFDVGTRERSATWKILGLNNGGGGGSGAVMTGRIAFRLGGGRSLRQGRKCGSLQLCGMGDFYWRSDPRRGSRHGSRGNESRSDQHVEDT